MSFRFPTLFVAHGTPMLAFGEDQYQKTLCEFSAAQPKPKAILVISAHSLSSEDIFVLNTRQNTSQHDFVGFPKELYDLKYNCPGDPDLAEQTHQLLHAGGFKVQFDAHAPFGHAIWIPLMHLYPEGDVPVVRVSLPVNQIPVQILKMGHLLANLREQGVMILCIGGAVHNLQKLEWSKKNGEGLPWAKNFEAWVVDALQKKDVDALLVASDENPDFKNAHPTQEHYLPLILAVGATLPNDNLTILQRGIEYNTLSMLTFSLNHAQNTALH